MIFNSILLSEANMENGYIINILGNKNPLKFFSYTFLRCGTP